MSLIKSAKIRAACKTSKLVTRFVRFISSSVSDAVTFPSRKPNLDILSSVQISHAFNHIVSMRGHGGWSRI